MKIELDTIKVWELYTYIRQMHLSLDRVSNRDWSDLIGFYNDANKPKTVQIELIRIIRHASHRERILDNSILVWVKSLRDRILRFVSGTNTVCLDYETLAQISVLLALVAEYLLRKDTPPENDEISLLRTALISVNRKIGNQLPMKMKMKSKKIEHCNQNPKAEHYPLEKIIKGEWAL